jgi:hypothetical protein
MNKAKLNEFVDYVLSFYGSAKKYDRVYDIGEVTRMHVLEALAIRLMPDCCMLNEFAKPINTIPFEGDSFDREYVRDIIIANR